jgi:rhodanese-related sulfurtransferase
MVQEMAKQRVTANELQELLNEEGNGVVVDIREGWERRRQWIAGSLHVPMGELGRESDGWAPGNPVILVCKSGARSRRAAAMLRKKGLTRVADLEGGMDAWSRVGLEVEGDPGASGASMAPMRLMAALLVMVGWLASHWWAPAIWLSVIVGAGLLLVLLTGLAGSGAGPSTDAGEAGCGTGGG